MFTALSSHNKIDFVFSAVGGGVCGSCKFVGIKMGNPDDDDFRRTADGIKPLNDLHRFALLIGPSAQKPTQMVLC